MFLYAIWRPINESMRGDAVRGFWWGLTTSQLVSIPVFLGAILILIFRFSKGTGEEKAFQPLQAEDIGEAPRL